MFDFFDELNVLVHTERWVIKASYGDNKTLLAALRSFQATFRPLNNLFIEIYFK